MKVLVDDGLDQTWPEVSEGTLRLLASEEGRAAGVAPFAIFSTKLLLAPAEAADGNLAHLRRWRHPHRRTEADFLGRRVATLHVPPPPTRIERLANGWSWQTLRETRVGRLVLELRRGPRGLSRGA